ncbi:MAG TPA: suppressor of fused domain protein [Chloroflexia bacterium]|nr:suppressor of fused domain protein [Chloroflexia bacterium]
MDPVDPFLPPPAIPAADADTTFARIWEIRDALVQRVWGPFDGVYVQRSRAGSGPYVYVSEIGPPAPVQPPTRWTYVTGGLALPWSADLAEVNAEDYSATLDQVDAEALSAAEAQGLQWSGAGFELVLHTPHQAPWAVHVLHNLGQYVLQSGDGFASGHRIPLDGPIIRDSESALQVLLLAPPADRAPLFKLPSGLAQWLVAIGITRDEWQFAQRAGSAALLGALRHAGVGDLTDPARASIFAG